MRPHRRRTLKGWIGLLAYPLLIATNFLSQTLILVVWIWTAVLGYRVSGLWGAFVAAVTPFLSPILIIWYGHVDRGSWISDYSIAVYSVPATFVVATGAAWLVTRAEKAEAEAEPDEALPEERYESQSAAG